MNHVENKFTFFLTSMTQFTTNNNCITYQKVTSEIQQDWHRNWSEIEIGMWIVPKPQWNCFEVNAPTRQQQQNPRNRKKEERFKNERPPWISISFPTFKYRYTAVAIEKSFYIYLHIYSTWNETSKNNYLLNRTQ